MPAFTGAVTITSLVAVAFGHAPVPTTLYVIVAVPAVNPLINPVLVTVAIAVFDELQVPPVIPLLVNVVFCPIQIF